MDVIKYSEENFLNAIRSKICSYYSDNNEDFTFKKINADLKEFVLSRISLLLKHTEFFIIEPFFVETEWNDMISLHYINTSYRFDVTVIRVHFLKEESICNENYLGFITLRRINEIRSMLSYIYPNFNYIGHKDKRYVIAYEKKVFIEDKELTFITYPCFVQDGIVASCVHSNILTICEFLHNTRGIKNIRLREIETDYTYRRTKQYPTRGLLLPQILEIFVNNRIPINNYVLLNNSNANKSKFEDYIKVYVESGIPVMVGIDEHVLHIIGHTISNNNFEYLVYDDSGAFLKSIHKEKLFLGCLKWKDIEERLSEYDFIIAPEYEKIYMSCVDFDGLFLRYIDSIKLLNKLKKYDKKKFKHITNEYIVKRKRLIIVENNVLKNFLYEHAIIIDSENNNYFEKFKRIFSSCKPLYFWYAEIEISENIWMCFIADPTYSKYTTSSIFYNSLPIFVDKQLTLLYEFDF